MARKTAKRMAIEVTEANRQRRDPVMLDGAVSDGIEAAATAHANLNVGDNSES
jgi:hypothetical protein